MANQVKFSDLFEGFDEGIAGLEKQISGVQTTLTNMLGEVKKKAEEMYGALQGVSSATKTDRDATSAYASEVERLHKDFEKLTQAIGLTNTQLENMAKKKIPSPKKEIDLANAYASLSDLIEKTGVNLEGLIKTEKQKTIADKNGEVANKALAGSYNQLYAQYNLIKNALNAMGRETQEQIEITKVWEAEALSIMDRMKAMQEATGKHTLSVGNYSKAIGGLNLSMAQVVREAPTLANSLNQFAVAISNNIPILMDNIRSYTKANKEARAELKAFIAEGKTYEEAVKLMGTSANNLRSIWSALVGSLFSLNTVVVAAVVAFELIAKAIDKKRREQEEANRTLRESISLSAIHRKTLNGEADAISSQTGKLKELYAIMLDVNREEKDRQAALEAIHRLTKIQISDINDASRAVADYIDKLDKQAQAEEKITRILALKAEIRDAEDRIAAIKETKEYEKALKKVAEAEAAYNSQVKARENEEYLKVSQGRINAARALEEEKLKAFQKADAKIKALTREQVTLQENNRVEIKKIQDELTQEYIDALNNETTTTKENLDKAKDYYWDYMQTKTRLISDELTREVALSDLAIDKQIAGYKNELATNNELTIDNQNYINGIILNLEVEKERKRLDIVKEWTSKRLEELSSVYEEEALKEDDSISGRYERLLADQSQKILASRVKLNDALESNSYREAKKEGKIFKDLTIEKLKLEADFQRELLKMRLDTGELTQDQYDIELAGIEDKLAKSIAGLNKRGRKQKFSIWNLVFGETKEDGKGNVFKELDEEAKAFVDAFTSSMQMAFDYMDEWMDKRIEMAEIAVEAAEKESEAAKTALDYEMEARANGYANNVELARKEYEEKLKLEQDAIAEKERLQKIQEAIDTATQFSSLVTATALLWASHAGFGPAAPVLAAIATAAMWASFAAAKIQAAQMTSTKYGEGMSEYIDYGGSHASGNDVDFGADKRGRRRRVERGEVIGVINKRNVDKYGVKTVTDVINSLNKGTFEDYISSKVTERDIAKTNVANVMNSLIGESHYASVVNSLNRQSLAEIVAPEMNADLYHLAFAGLDREGVSLGGVESRLQTLIEQGETRVVPTADGRIEYRGNNKRIIHNS